MRKSKFMSFMGGICCCFNYNIRFPITVSTASENSYAEWFIIDDDSYFIYPSDESLFMSFCKSDELTITPSYCNTGSSYASGAFKLTCVGNFDALSNARYSTLSSTSYYGLVLTSNTEVTIDTEFSKVSNEYLNYDVRIVWVNHDGNKGLDNSGVTITVGEDESEDLIM